MISETSELPNSKTLFIISLSSLLITPCSSDTSTIVFKSSSVTLSLSLLSLIKSFPIELVIRPRIKDKGVKIILKNLIGLATFRDNTSGFAVAIFLGVTSPKIRTTIVKIIGEITAPLGPKTSVKKIVAMVVVTIFTMLFPIRIVVSTLVILSTNFLRIWEFLTPFFSICLILNVLILVRAVSDEEKNAENTTPKIMRIS